MVGDVDKPVIYGCIALQTAVLMGVPAWQHHNNWAYNGVNNSGIVVLKVQLVGHVTK